MSQQLAPHESSDPQPTTYQGRALPKPDEELVDQGLQFDIGTLFSRRVLGRRGLLSLVGAGAAGITLAACSPSVDATTSSSPSATATTATNSPSSSASTTSSSSSSATGSATDALTEIPDETAGPYPGDGSNGPDVLEQSGVVRQDIRSSFGTGSATAEGVPMTLELVIRNITEGGAPFAGAAVYVWHCTREGAYSMYGSGIENENFLRGVQIADDEGKVSFTSIFPGCYSGRWPHVHFEVYPSADDITDASKAIATSQVAIPQNTCEAVYATEGYDASVGNLASLTLQSDNVFGNDGGVHQLATVSGDVSSGFTVTLPVAIDTTTAPTGGGQGGPPGR